MNIVDIENKRLDLLKALNKKYSPRRKLLLLSNFFYELFESKDHNLINSYLLEFAEDYIINLSKWNVFYLPPDESVKILEFLDKIRATAAFKPFDNNLELSVSRLSNQISSLNKILEGRGEINTEISGNIHFPLIEEDLYSNKNEPYSYLESATVKISRGSGKNRFIIVPSPKILEERLEHQIEASWMVAIDVIKKYCRKVYEYHDVVINFNYKLGEYTGDSLGMAMTLAFLQELFSFYNTPIKLTINSGTAFSGGVNRSGEIIPISNRDYIKSKLECVFFSPINSLVLHKTDEEVARAELNKYLEIYPERNLKIVGVEDFEDLKNRRNIISINKQKLFVRAAKLISRYKIASIFILLIVLSSLYININFDNNPAYFTNITNRVYIHNKNGRILWSKKLAENYNNSSIAENMGKLFCKIVNVDQSGNNEVIISRCILDKDGENGKSYVVCFDSNGRVIWKYNFQDTVSTKKDSHNNYYNSFLIDTLSEKNHLEIMLFARNNPLYPSAIYKLDARLGKRIPGTFWHAGHILSVLIGKYGNNGERELVGLAISNCFERCVLFSLNINDINGQAPANNIYSFYKKPIAKLIKYILLPKSDYTNFYNIRFNTALLGALTYHDNDKYFDFAIQEAYKPDSETGIAYQTNSTLTDIKVFVGDEFQVARDSLVAKGLIPKPYSNTNEYVSILKKQIKYWDGREFKNMY